MTAFNDALLDTVVDDANPLHLGPQFTRAINMPSGRCSLQVGTMYCRFLADLAIDADSN